MDRVIYTRPWFQLNKIVNATSLAGFHIRKQMPHPPSFGMRHHSVDLVLYVVITFIWIAFIDMKYNVHTYLHEL